MKRGKTATTAITRRESNQKTKRSFMCQQILIVLYQSAQPLTAREIAIVLHDKGVVKYPARSTVQPRLTEMLEDGEVIVAGKVFDAETNRRVAAYKLPEGRMHE